ncbi:YraN family protein [Dyadobacter sandarakinus]|uniref:UPF0102 protein HWI92_19500 n=1 Tax=Dyadobacter sandarakinus TaxID=2747268 RepID=A0ABX7IB39_9BACT|nr:YraN family protein [Dyadobacter sandarakinus]QRR02938.1 YraN family protein [Dyadobacter sandarakinus]
MGINNERGSWGERKAEEYLIRKGFAVLEKNYRYKHSEIDLIVTVSDMLIFVEVKTRSGTAFGMPEEFVNAGKAGLVKKAAEYYIYDKDWQQDVRFDIVSVLVLPDGQTEIYHIEDAFC